MRRTILLVLITACSTSQKSFEEYVIKKYGEPEHGWRRASGVILKNPVPADERSLTNGSNLYQRICSGCHGVAGLGDGVHAKSMSPPPANLQLTAALKTESHIFMQISLGREGMPMGNKSLEVKDRWDIVNFVKSFGSAK